MSFDYTKSATTALNLIKKFGRQYNTRRNANTPNGVTGANAVVTTTGTLDAVILPANKSLYRLDNTTAEELIQANGKFIIAAAKTATMAPKPDDDVSIDGEWWNVMGVTTLKPAAVPVIYFLGVIRK